MLKIREFGNELELLHYFPGRHTGSFKINEYFMENPKYIPTETRTGPLNTDNISKTSLKSY